MNRKTNKYLDYIEKLNNIGVALSAERNPSKLLEKILLSAIDLVHTDGGTLYLLTADKALSFELVVNKSLNLQIQHKEGDPPFFPAIKLFNADDSPNLKNVASYCYLENKTVHIEDAYKVQGYDFSGMKVMDKKLGYHSQSFLTIPLRNHENKTIGVLQLINAIDEESGAIVAFSEDKIRIAESLASQAAITLTQKELILAQKKLFEALIQLIAKSIDEKSKYTSKHCSRVPILTLMIAEAVHQMNSGYYKDLRFTADEFEELRVAAWLHDCGKIITPVNIVDKATKLEAITDRIEVIHLRLEILLRDLKLEYLQQKISEKTYQAACDEVNAARDFFERVNIGAEFLTDADKDKIKQFAERTFVLNGVTQHLLSQSDVANLSISRGTLNDEDRTIINNHVSLSYQMLSLLPYPEYLKNVPEIAGGHHERYDGKGYPNQLAGEKIPLQSRILAIADIFEALTAADRPYKKAKTLKETLQIMADMKNVGHIDPELFDLFMQNKIYLMFAKEYLSAEQIDVE